MNHANQASDTISLRRRRRSAVSFLAAVLLLVSLTGCSGGNTQAEIGGAAVNQSAENAARVFAKATFSGDKDVLFACFPAVYTSALTNEDLKKYDSWSSEIKDALASNKSSYLGTSASDAELFSKEKDPDKYNTALSSISLTFGIESSKIEEIRSCKVRVFCMIDKDKNYQDVDVIVYKYDGAWYADPSA